MTLRTWAAEYKRYAVNRTSWLYFVSGGPTIKIGFTTGIDKRLRGLCASSPVRLRLLLVIPGGWEIEQYLHRRYADIRSHYEWFRADERLLAHIQALRLRHHCDEDDRTYEFGTRLRGEIDVDPFMTR